MRCCQGVVNTLPNQPTVCTMRGDVHCQCVYRFGRFVVLKFPKLCVIELSYKDNFKIFYNFLVAYWVPTRIFPTLGKSYYLFKILYKQIL